jgi:hypothetical protein
MRNRICLVLVGGALLAGCSGDNKVSTYIKAWSVPIDQITVGQTTPPLPVELSAAPTTDKLYVDVENTHTQLVLVDPMLLTYKVDEVKKTVTLKGVAPTPGTTTISVKFTIRGSTESREMEFRVVGSLTPDSGPMPDLGPQPDKGTPQPDKGAPDTATADK